MIDWYLNPPASLFSFGFNLFCFVSVLFCLGLCFLLSCFPTFLFCSKEKVLMKKHPQIAFLAYWFVFLSFCSSFISVCMYRPIWLVVWFTCQKIYTQACKVLRHEKCKLQLKGNPSLVISSWAWQQKNKGNRMAKVWKKSDQ